MTGKFRQPRRRFALVRSTHRMIVLVCFLFQALLLAVPLLSFGAQSATAPEIEYARDPGTVLVSFREVTPVFANQDPAPLIRVYGDGRVVVHQPVYKQNAGQYEMLLSPPELETLLLELTGALIDFDAAAVKAEKQFADELLKASVEDPGELILFHDTDAEISVFRMNIEAYRPAHASGEAHYQPDLDRSWRGLRHDARDYPGLAPLQNLMRAEMTLRALAAHEDLVRVE